MLGVLLSYKAVKIDINTGGFALKNQISLFSPWNKFPITRGVGRSISASFS